MWNWNRPPHARRRHNCTLRANRFPFLFLFISICSSSRCYIFVGFFHSRLANAHLATRFPSMPADSSSVSLCVRPQFGVRKFSARHRLRIISNGAGFFPNEKKKKQNGANVSSRTVCNWHARNEECDGKSFCCRSTHTVLLLSLLLLLPFVLPLLGAAAYEGFVAGLTMAYDVLAKLFYERPVF